MTWQRIAIVALIQTIILVGMVVTRNAPYANGTEVVLRTEPVDPRDLMRGYYVRLGYDISRLTVPADVGGQLSMGEAIYVVLEEGDDGLWSAGNAFAREDAIPEGALYIRGEVTSVITSPRSAPTMVDGEAVIEPRADEGEMPTIVRATYGIERYYASQQLAQELEGLQREDRMAVAVMVSPTGAAGIRALIIDGERVSEEGLF